MQQLKNPISPTLTTYGHNTVKEEAGSISLSLAEIRTDLKNGNFSLLNDGIKRSQEHFFREQLPEGYWWAELESNVTITAEYLMLFHILDMVDKEREGKIVNYLLEKQTEEGYWTIYYGGPGDLSTTIEAYFALKLAGIPAEHPAMKKAREFVLENGGIIKSRVFTKIFLAIFGEFSWLGIPSMPIELMLLPNWAYFNMYELSSWSRATIIPLSVVMSERPVVKIPESATVQELYVRPPKPIDYTFTREDGLFTWKNFFIGIDHLLKVYEKISIRPLKKRGMAAAEKWVLEHQEETGDWGGIQPAMLNAVLCLHTMGYSSDNPAVVKGLEALAEFAIETEDKLVLQSCISPVWDTALALKALADSGVPCDAPEMVKATDWLLSKEIGINGDWKIKASELKPGGWAFEFDNNWYPDVDDSGFVMMAIKDIQVEDSARKDAAIERGIDWCLGMQSKNGGWGAFDRDNTKHLLNKIPFADLEALIDPPTADLTGRMLELMGAFGRAKDSRTSVRAIDFIKKEQEKDGSWWGRWGVNYIYGTWSVLCGLAAIGEDLSQLYIKKGVNWLKRHQNRDGGWGETCESYHDRNLAGIGESTASQTAWALLGLMAAGEVDSDEVEEGVAYLLRTQRADGAWDEDQYTGTGFPKYFMIKYHIYRNCFPLTALGTYRNLKDGSKSQ
ncbi:MAG: squalene--hopene cyclase [Desulfuromonadales bacterium]|nr:squalene--hopene cyclase [Desulfuromonadales bacterium]